MMKTLLLTSAAVVGLSLAAAPSKAGIVNGADFTTGASSQTIDGITWNALPTNRTFVVSTFGSIAGGGPFTGVGISGGQTNTEIDIGEFLVGGMFSGGPRTVNSFTVGLLYDGPEFGDVQEVAQVTFTLGGGGSIAYTLTNNFNGLGTVWTGPGSVTQLSGDGNANAPLINSAVWRVDGIDLANVTGVEFTALPGLCGNGACNNQSDYVLVQFVTTLQQVPEPATLGLLGAGLLGLGFAARRRKAA